MKIDERHAPANSVGASGEAARRGRPALGWRWELWCFAALWLVFAGVGVWTLTAEYTDANRERGDKAVALSLGAALFSSVWLLGRYRVRLRRHTVGIAAEPSGDEDAGRRVLYLRSFSADETASRRTGLVTEEEELEEALRELGEFTAVGEPGEELPDVGASRFYVEDARWEEVVCGLMTKARLVVMRVGDTDGFWKEMRWAAEVVRPERLVLLLPADREAYETFRRKAEALLRRPLPEFYSVARVGSLCGLLHFDADGTPRREHFTTRLLRGTAKHKESYKLKYALRPVYERLGARWTRPRLGGVTWTLAGIALFVLFVCVYALYVRAR